MRWNKNGHGPRFAARFGVMMIGRVVVGGLAVMILWNWLGPALFAWKEITFLQSVGVLILSRVLFGGFTHRAPFGGGHMARLAARFEGMTPEEREELRSRWRSHGHHGRGRFGRCGEERSGSGQAGGEQPSSEQPSGTIVPPAPEAKAPE